MNPPLITLLTDFGTGDPYVGILEIVYNQGSAAEILGLDCGDAVLFQW